MDSSFFNKAKLQEALDNFRQYSKDKKFQEDSEERSARIQYFQQLFREKFSELSFSEVVKKLWASQIWGNKDYLVSKIISSNGLDKLAQEFEYLVSHKDSPGDRYEKFTGNIKYLGPANVSEILCYSDPDNAGIWNDRAREALAWLEAKGAPFRKYKISGEEYNSINNTLKSLAEILTQEGYSGVNLLFVDYFLFRIADSNIVTTAKQKQNVEESVSVEKIKELSRHDEIRDKLAQIGSWLGFEIETEKLVAVGAKLDVVWQARIANLGSVSYVFEVQDRGSIDSLILNLQRAQGNPTVQKLVVVSDTDQIEKIKKEADPMPESFRRAVVYWGATEVDSTYQSLQQVSSSIAKLKLVGD